MPTSKDALAKFTLILLCMIDSITALIAGLPNLTQAQISMARILRIDGALSPVDSCALVGDDFSHSIPLRLELINVCHQDGDPQSGERKLRYVILLIILWVVFIC